MAAALCLCAWAAPLRADSVGPQAKAAPFRVALLGTSLTKNGGWDTALEARLSDCLERPVEVLNFGGAGMTSRWGLTQVDRVKAAAPDLVAIEFSANDASLLKGFSIAESVANARQIIQRLRAAEEKPRVVLMAMNPMHGLRSWVRPWLDQYYDAYQPLAVRMDVGFLDMRPRWRALGAKALRAAVPDGVHPKSAVASRIVAGPLAAIISDYSGGSCR